jgi:hypothetical protein
LANNIDKVIDTTRSKSILLDEGLPVTRDELLEEFDARIKEEADGLIVDLAPYSVERHDYFFKVDKETNGVTEGVIIGEIEAIAREES